MLYFLRHLELLFHTEDDRDYGDTYNDGKGDCIKQKAGSYIKPLMHNVPKWSDTL